jgi:uncharacterized protein YndB with AHSA1/START domain
MSLSAAAPGIESLSLTVNLETRIRASLETSFAALIEQLGPGFETPEGNPMPFKIEAWPGGRWYRDLGDGNGHFWATVQAIKRPTLLEFCGPLFMSSAVISNVQYRLSEIESGTLIAFRHFALGVIPEDTRQGLQKGWAHINDRIRARAEFRR